LPVRPVPPTASWGFDINRYLQEEASALARRDGLSDVVEFREGNAEALPFGDGAFDVTLSVTVIEEVDAERMMAEMVRVTRPGGRVVTVARATDVPLLMNVVLPSAPKAKVQMPGFVGAVAERGCADASLSGVFARPVSSASQPSRTSPPFRPTTVPSSTSSKMASCPSSGGWKRMSGSARGRRPGRTARSSWRGRITAWSARSRDHDASAVLDALRVPPA